MIIRTSPDKEKAKSMLFLLKERENFVSIIDIQRFPTMAAEGYYEIIKELAMIVLLLDGLKVIGENAHKEAIENCRNYNELEEEEIKLMDDLRIKRNKSSYEGKSINAIYLENKRDKLLFIIKKLKDMVNKKLILD